MTPERSGKERRANWPPTCERHDEVVKLSASLHVWGVVLMLAWGAGIAVIKWSADRAIVLAENVTKLDTQLQLSVADRALIHKEIEAMKVRVEALEVCIRPVQVAPFERRK